MEFEKRRYFRALKKPEIPQIDLATSLSKPNKVRVKPEKKESVAKDTDSIISLSDDNVDDENEEDKIKAKKLPDCFEVSDSSDEEERFDVSNSKIRESIENDPNLLRWKKGFTTVAKKKKEQLSFAKSNPETEAAPVIVKDLVIEETTENLILKRLEEVKKSFQLKSKQDCVPGNKEEESKVGIVLKFRLIQESECGQETQKRRKELFEVVTVGVEDTMKTVIEKFFDTCKQEQLLKKTKKKIRFMFDGEKVNEKDTVAGLDLEGNEIIDVIY